MITALNIVIVVGLIVGFILGQIGVINWIGALVLVVVGGIGAALLYPHAFPRQNKK